MNQPVTDNISLKKKNGWIEFQRFIFAIIVALLHFTLKVTPDLKPVHHLRLFAAGNMGVEFFFLVSGWLLAKKTAPLQDKKSEQLGTETIHFIWGKIKAILPYYILAFPLLTLTTVLYERFSLLDSFKYIFLSWPSFFCLKILGFNANNPLGANWYIGTMLVVMMIYYPLLRKNYDLFSKVVAPLLAIFIVGWLSHKYNSLNTPEKWTGLCYKGLLRAFAEIALGIVSYELTCLFDKKVESDNMYKFLNPFLLFLLVVMILVLNIQSGKLNVSELAVLFVLVTLSFSGKHTLTSFFNNKVVYTLGNVSLPLYLSHNASWMTLLRFFDVSKMAYGTKILVYVILAAFYTIVVYSVGNLIKKRLLSKKSA